MSSSEEQIVEKIAFKTDILSSYDSSEQRIALRSRPRRYLSFRYDASETWQAHYLRMATSAQQNKVVYTPLWHCACILTEDVEKGGYYFKIEKERLWAFRECNACYFYYGDMLDGSGSYFEIEAYNNDGTVKLKKPVKSRKPKGTCVLPILPMILQPEDSMISRFSNDSGMTLNFEILPVTDYPKIPDVYLEGNKSFYDADRPAYQIADTYNGFDVLRYEPTWSSDIEFGHDKNVNKLDNDTGTFLYYLKSGNISEHRSIEYITPNIVETYNLQRFFYRCRGQLVPFYAPTWLNDFNVDKDIKLTDGYISVEFNQYYLYYSGNSNRKQLIIFKTDYTTVILNIVGYSNYEDETGKKHGKLLVSGLNGNIQIKDILMVSFFCKYRLTTDELEIKYDTTEVSTVTLPMKEIQYG